MIAASEGCQMPTIRAGRADYPPATRRGFAARRFANDIPPEAVHPIPSHAATHGPAQ